MSKPDKLYGIVPATVTPFHRDESVDTEAMLRLMEWNMSQGAEHFFHSGCLDGSIFTLPDGDCADKEL